MSNNITSGWPKKIRVDRKIVNLLSRSLYADFPRAIRELISNAYDADATEVRINVSIRNKEITVEDNGNGMSPEQFGQYLMIAGETIEGGQYSPKFNRRRIGRFGVGFLASFPFCERIEITSKKEGSAVGFVAVIPSKRLVEGIGIEEEVSDVPVDGYSEPSPGKLHEHYTKVKMFGLNSLVNEYFDVKAERKRSSIESYRGADKLKWQLCETLPLDFKDKKGSMVAGLGNTQVGMEVLLNDTRLYRNDPGGQLLESTQETYIVLGNLEFKYAISTNWQIIHPVEARGLKIRINNVGIGPRSYLDVETEVRTFSRLNWISGEIHILKGLDESLALNRDSFTWSQDYQQLKEMVHRILVRVAGWVERVAYTEKKLIDVFDKKSEMPTTSTSELIDWGVNRFKNAGFEIRHSSIEVIRKATYPLVIDKRSKIVTVIDDHPDITDIVEVPTGDALIKYVTFERDVRSTVPVRISNDGSIEVNSAYPLFQGKARGNLMKRLHILMFLAQQECETIQDMYDYLVKEIRDEFE